MIIGKQNIQQVVFGGEILPLDKCVPYIVEGIRRGRVFIRSPKPYMLELENRFQLASVFAAYIADALCVRLTFAHRK